jgi:hypothetical protein
VISSLALVRQPVGSELVAALERAWGAIEERHPDVPAAVVTVGSGSAGRPRGLRLGHFAASRWSANPSPSSLGEGEGLDRGSVDVFGTLLHEAAHALAHARGLHDTSRQGRYHNRRFAQLGDELGLQVEHHAQLGWSLTSLRASTIIAYDSALADLERALLAHRLRERPSPPRAPNRSGAVAMCACGRRIRIAPGVLALGPVLCGVCVQPFRESFSGH